MNDALIKKNRYTVELMGSDLPLVLFRIRTEA